MAQKISSAGSTIPDFYAPHISVSDAASMLRRTISSNERPYTREAIEANNTLVNRWEREVLGELANSQGKVHVSQVYPSWTVFEEGIRIKTLKENETHIQSLSEEEIAYWRELFESSDVIALHALGTGYVAHGWDLLVKYIQFWYVTQKWQRVYSKSDNPTQWFQDSLGQRLLFKGEERPFWTDEQFMDVEQKVRAILTATPRSALKLEEQHAPRYTVEEAAGMIRKTIVRNEVPYTRKVWECNNQLVEAWKENVLVNLADEDGKIRAEQINASWMAFEEGRQIKQIKEHERHIQLAPDEEVAYWKDLFERSTITQLHFFGNAYVAYGWDVITRHFRFWNGRQKMERVYSRSEDPKQWYVESLAHPDLFEGRELPFWTPDILRSVGQKIGTLFAVVVSVE